MRKFRMTLTLAALLTGAAGTLANGQNAPGIPPSGARTFLDSDIRLSTDYPPITSKTFRSTPVLPLKKGTVLPARGVIGPLGLDQMWSLRQHEFTLGTRTVNYPVIGSVRCSNFSDTGSFTRVIASTTVIQVNLKAGETLRSGGYRIEAKQAIQAGQEFPAIQVLFAGRFFILSIEEAPLAKNEVDGTKPQPRFTIVREPVNQGDREIALEAWRIANQSLREGILTGHP